jgi:hypothetical protein
VPATLGAARNIIKIIYSVDVKGNMAASLDKSQVATAIFDFG